MVMAAATKQRILIVDASRVVRATLGKHLRESFELVEAPSSEAALLTLRADADFAAIISGITPPKVDAYDLLRRLRAGELAPRRELPLTLVVSDLNSHADKESDLARGVAGFITKSMKKEEIIAYLDALLAASAPPQSQRPSPPLPGRVLDSERFSAQLAALELKSPARPGQGQAQSTCALVFAIDNRDVLISRFGQDIAHLIDTLFARLLVAKLGAHDLIGRCRGERLAIVTRGVDLKQGLRFGKQVCKGLAASSITVHGEKIRLTASVGIASTSADPAVNGSELFARADERLEQALMCGGNLAAAELRPACPLCRQVGAAERIGAAGLKILPFLHTLDRELALGLPLAEIRSKLEQRAARES